MKLLISIDDGHILDLKAAELLEKHGLRGIFFIPSLMRQLDDNQVRWLAEKGHEIGGHTVNHPMDMKLLDECELEYELSENKFQLEQITGQLVTAFCYPRGRFNNEVKRMVKKNGFAWARTTKVLQYKQTTDPYETPTGIHFYPERAEYNGAELLDLVEAGLKAAWKLKDKGVFHLWFHSKEVEEYGLWDQLDAVFGIMAKFEQSMQKPVKSKQK